MGDKTVIMNGKNKKIGKVPKFHQVYGHMAFILLKNQGQCNLVTEQIKR